MNQKSSRKRILSTNSETGKNNEPKSYENNEINGMNRIIENQNHQNIQDQSQIRMKSSLKSKNSKNKVLNVSSKVNYFQYTKMPSNDNINNEEKNDEVNNKKEKYLFNNVDDEVFIYLDTNDEDKNEFLEIIKSNNIMVNSEYYTDLLTSLKKIIIVRIYYS